MLPACFKYFFILFCGFYFYIKLLNLKTSKAIYIMQSFFSIVFAILIYYIRIRFASGSIMVLVTLFATVAYITYKQTINITIVSSLIALGCSYILYIISVLIISPLAYFLIQNSGRSLRLYDFSFLLVGIFQLLLSTIPFRFKRLKNGMPFLKQQGASDVGAFIAISLLMATSFFTVIAENNVYFFIPIFFIFVCGIIIYFWWKNKLTESYLKKLKERESNALQDEIKHLKLYNETLSKIIHKDNKLIPSMELSVKTALSEIADSLNQEEGEKLTCILAQLESISKERKGILHICNNQAKDTYSTGAPAIDNLLQYLSARAYSEQINFEVLISQRLQAIIPEIISEADFRTLVADLAENALIAVKNQTHRNVLVHTRMEKSIFYIDFYDSGIPFSEKVLWNLGKQRITTREKEGGSGIGFMSTFEILKRCNASLVIDENSTVETYKKKITICFDSLEEYRIYTKEHTFVKRIN